MAKIVSDNSFNKIYIVGFVDVYCKKYAIGIEVKTEIPVIGDLIRQIQFYRKYLTGSWIVVSPDDRNSNILKEQGIHFIGMLAHGLTNYDCLNNKSILQTQCGLRPGCRNYLF